MYDVYTPYIMSMIRKQIFITEELDRRLAVAAKQQRKAEAQIIREALADKLDQRRSMTAGGALLGLAGLGQELGIQLGPDASVRIDNDLYGNR